MPSFTQPTRLCHHHPVLLPDFNFHWPAADFAVIIQHGREFIETRHGDLKRLETGRAGDLGEFHGWKIPLMRPSSKLTSHLSDRRLPVSMGASSSAG